MEIWRWSHVVHLRPFNGDKIQKRISGPLVDSINVHFEVPPANYQKLSNDRLEKHHQQYMRIEAFRPNLIAPYVQPYYNIPTMLSPVLRTKITPPLRKDARTLARPRVFATLQQAFDYRLTILKAGAGYGKSTALAELAVELQPLIWYQVNDEDNDPLVFIQHLCHAARLALPGIPDLPITYFESWDGKQGPLPWRGVLDQLINALSTHLDAPTLFVLDDAHVVTESGEVVHILDRLIGLALAHLHVLLSGRPTSILPTFSRLRAKGEVLILDQAALTFTSSEIALLFATHYGVELTTDEVNVLVAYTEGWAIALQLIWQSIRSQPGGSMPPVRHAAGTTPAAWSSSILEFPSSGKLAP
jgi:ATP/maltotriose-dependent transcriptional regulator MalT